VPGLRLASPRLASPRLAPPRLASPRPAEALGDPAVAADRQRCEHGRDRDGQASECQIGVVLGPPSVRPRRASASASVFRPMPVPMLANRTVCTVMPGRTYCR
jgi:hypothetical protein